MLPELLSKLRPAAKGEALPDRAEPIATAATHYVNGRPLKGPYPPGIETAIFGMGCFWGAERKLWQAGEGIHGTAVGYAGGATPNPTYEETCTGRTGHAEVVLVAYDPAKISYDELLKLFWEDHDPTQGMRQGNDVGTQYRSAIYATTPEQFAVARRSAEAYQAGAERQGFWQDHDRERRGRALPLRRRLPPAVSRQEPRRRLRARRHRGVVRLGGMQSAVGNGLGPRPPPDCRPLRIARRWRIVGEWRDFSSSTTIRCFARRCRAR